jgi:hypothetical protein
MPKVQPCYWSNFHLLSREGFAIIKIRRTIYINLFPGLKSTELLNMSPGGG